MKHTEQTKQTMTAQQAAGLVFSGTTGKVYAALVCRRGDGFEQTYSAVFDAADGADSAVRRLLEQAGAAPTPIVVGVDAARLRFIELSLPPASPAQLPQLIRTQAESRLPLDGDRLRLAWRLAAGPQGYDCTVAAMRRETTDAAMDRLGLDGSVAAIAPAAAGFARLRQACFAPTPEVCVVLRRRGDGVELILLDGASPVWCAVVFAEGAAVVTQDVLMELEAVERKLGRKAPAYLWPGEDAMLRQAAAGLTQAGWETAALEPNRDALAVAGLDVQADRDGPRLDAAGLAVLGLSQTEPAFDFLQTQRLARPAQDARQRRKKMIGALAVTAALAAVCVLAAYWSLSLEVRRLRRELAVEVDGVKAATVLQRQTYQEATARARLDVLELIEAIQDARDGLLLDSIDVEKGRPVRLIASAGGYEQVYGFQKRLQTQDGVTEVRLIDPRLDERDRQVRFTLQFHYKHYTR